MIKKPPFPEQLKPPRMKGVLSGAGLWAGACIALVSLLVISNSFKGHNGFSPISTWHFPRSSSTNTRNDAIGGGGGGRASGVVLEKEGGTQLGNSSSGGGNSTGSPVDNGKKGVIFGGTQLGNYFSGGTRLGNSSSGGGNSTSSSGDNGKKGVIFGGTQLGNYSSGGTQLRNSSSSGSVNVDVTAVNSGGNNESCDIFDGRWVRDDDDGSRPHYPAGSCPYIDRDFNCHLNGRPDDGFLKWRWQPNKCDIPSLNGTDFLERLRGKKLVFVGDSLNRNMWESLVCILRQSIRDKKRVYEISGRREFKKKGFYAFRFEDYNCTVDFIGSPFLVRESGFRSENGTIETLRLDLMDRTTSMYHDADIIVFNTGHWWTHEKTSRGENYYQEGNHVYPRLKVMEAYKRALSTWAKWVDKNIDSKLTLVFFRGYSVTHFRGGQWNSGGQCHSETEPIYNTSYLAKYPSKMKAFEHVLQGMKTPVVYMNISRLTDYRKDGHPSIYGMAHKTAEERTAALRSQDCSHWCLPGVPDVWNELLYASILKATNGSSRA